MAATTPPGRVVRDGDAVTLELTRDLSEPVAQVWAALTDPARTAGWIGTWSGDPATGTIDFVMTAEGVTDPQPVEVRECREPERLALTMPGPEGPWDLVVVLTPGPVGDMKGDDAGGDSAGGRTKGDGPGHDDEAGTSLRFTQALAPPYDASSIGPGWHYYLDRMVAVLRGEEPTTDFDAYYPATSAAYAIPD